MTIGCNRVMLTLTLTQTTPKQKHKTSRMMSSAKRVLIGSLQQKSSLSARKRAIYSFSFKRLTWAMSASNWIKILRLMTSKSCLKICLAVSQPESAKIYSKRKRPKRHQMMKKAFLRSTKTLRRMI